MVRAVIHEIAEYPQLVVFIRQSRKSFHVRVQIRDDADSHGLRASFSERRLNDFMASDLAVFFAAVHLRTVAFRSPERRLRRDVGSDAPGRNEDTRPSSNISTQPNHKT